MVKKNYKCVICAKIGQVYCCNHCQHNFCRECIESYNPTWILVNLDTPALISDETMGNDQENNTAMEDSETANILDPSFREELSQDIVLQRKEAIPKSNRICVNYCAFNCIKSLGDNYCYDCGGNYMRNKKCLACSFNFCTLCQKHNLFETKNIQPEYHRLASLFCSKTCYEIYNEQPNNEWCICENCGEEYFDIAYKKCCDLCLEKYNFHNHKTYNEKRTEIINNLKEYIGNNQVNIEQIENRVQADLEIKTQTYQSIKKNKIDLITWFTSSHIGNNLSYNIWDEVISDFLIKN